MDGVLDALWPAFFLAHGYVTVALGMGVVVLCYLGLLQVYVGSAVGWTFAESIVSG